MPLKHELYTEKNVTPKGVNFGGKKSSGKVIFSCFLFVAPTGLFFFDSFVLKVLLGCWDAS